MAKLGMLGGPRETVHSRPVTPRPGPPPADSAIHEKEMGLRIRLSFADGSDKVYSGIQNFGDRGDEVYYKRTDRSSFRPDSEDIGKKVVAARLEEADGTVLAFQKIPESTFILEKGYIYQVLFIYDRMRAPLETRFEDGTVVVQAGYGTGKMGK